MHHYTHKKFRVCVNGIAFYLPRMFTYQKQDNVGMATNNKIAGVSTALKNSALVHSGITEENRRRVSSVFFWQRT